MTTMRRGSICNVLSSYCKKKRNWFKGENEGKKQKILFCIKVFQELRFVFLDDIRTVDTRDAARDYTYVPLTVQTSYAYYGFYYLVSVRTNNTNTRNFLFKT